MVKNEPHSIRYQPTTEGDIIIVGGKSKAEMEAKTPEEAFRLVEGDYSTKFTIKHVAYQWFTEDFATKDGAPYIGQLSRSQEHVYAATGFNGWGMTNGVVAGMILSDRITSKNNEWSDFIDKFRKENRKLKNEAQSLSYSEDATIYTMATYEDFEKLDIRVGKIIEVVDFPEARKPAYKLTIDFGDEIGTKKSSAQLPQNYTKQELQDRQILAVVNFPPRQIGPFISEVLTLGVPTEDGSCMLVVPDRSIPVGGRLYWFLTTHLFDPIMLMPYTHN